MTTQAEFSEKLDEYIGVQPKLKDLLELLAGISERYEEAMQGDIVMTITPATATPSPTSAAWTRDVVVTIENAAGDTHDWLNGAYTTTVSVGNTSTAGTASITSTTLTLVNGTATIEVSGDAAAWLNTETDTLTIGNLSIMGYTVTGGTSVDTFTT